MSVKEFINQFINKKLLIHLGIVIALFFIIAYVVLSSLDSYTNHGESIEVPDLKEMSIDEAKQVLKNLELNYQIIDSVYMADKRPGIIVEQTPGPLEKIKQHRQLYLVINSYQKPLISIPDVKDLSYRNAKATLQGLGFVVDSVEYVPSEYKDLVKDVKNYSRLLTPGTRIPTGAYLILVVGKGSLGKESSAPSLHGLSYQTALETANRDSVSIRSVQFDADELPKTASDSSKFLVYKQHPIKGAPIAIGGAIDIWLTTKKALLDAPEDEYKKDSLEVQSKQSKPQVEPEFDF